MNKTLAIILAGLPLCAGLLSSCASRSSNESPPVQNAQNVETFQTAQESWSTNLQDPGSIQTVQESWGTKTIYKDAAGYIVQIEKRGTNNEYLPGACIREFTYNNGLRVAKQNLNSQGVLVCNDEGYATTKYAYRLDPGEQTVVEETFFDANDQPVVTKSGFAVMTCTKNPDGSVNTAHFSDFLNKPAPSVWHGVSNVVDVQYSYLQGVTPIVCGVFRDVHGNMIDRKQLKGLTSQVVVTEDPSDDDDDNYDVPIDSDSDHSSHSGGGGGGGSFHGGGGGGEGGFHGGSGSHGH